MILAILKGFQDGNIVTISCLPYSVGRCRSADFIIAHVNVSRNHCEIVKENGLWKISDFSSSGTYVNDALVGKGKSVILNNGDSIRFGPLENNLSWTFHSLDSPGGNSSLLNVKPETEGVLSFYNEKCFSKEDNVTNNLVHQDVAFEENNANSGGQNSFWQNKNCELSLKRAKNEAELSVIKQKTRVNNCEAKKESENISQLFSSAKEGNDVEKNEYKMIQELTKELKEVQSALNNLEEKNSALQVELASGVKDAEILSKTDLLGNFADLMEAEFQCTICSELFVTAITLSCTHTFCKFCINQWKKKQKTCPICRKKITNETRSLVVDNYIDKVVGNLSLELKNRREMLIKERCDIEPCQKKSKLKNKNKNF